MKMMPLCHANDYSTAPPPTMPVYWLITSRSPAWGAWPAMAMPGDGTPQILSKENAAAHTAPPWAELESPLRWPADDVAQRAFSGITRIMAPHLRSRLQAPCTSSEEKPYGTR